MSLLSFSLLYCLNTNGFHVAVGLFSNRSYKMSTCGKNVGNCEEELPKKPVGLLSVNCRPIVSRQVFWRALLHNYQNVNDTRLMALYATFLFVTLSDMICYLLLNRHVIMESIC